MTKKLSRNFYLSSPETASTAAFERVFHLINWKRKNSAEEAEVIVICDDELNLRVNDVADELDTFLHKTGQRMILIHPSSTVISASRQSLYFVFQGGPDLDSLFSWLSEDLSNEHKWDGPSINQLRELLYKDHFPSKMGEYPEHFMEKWPLFFEAKGISEFFISLLQISQDIDDEHHRSQRLFKPHLFDKNQTEDFIFDSQMQNFIESCYDLRMSLQTVSKKEIKPQHILVFDDRPEGYKEDLKKVLKLFGFQGDLWICKATNELAQETADYNSHKITRKLTRSIVDSSKRWPEDAKISCPSLEEFRFILVDQRYESADKIGKMLGPQIIKGLSRLLHDISSPDVPLPEIIALSRAKHPQVIQQALQAGARDYVLKSRLLGLPAALAKVRRTVSEGTRSYHRNFKALYRLPNETIGLLKAVKIPRIPFHRDFQNRSPDSEPDREIAEAQDISTISDDSKIGNRELKQAQVGIKNINVDKIAELLAAFPKPDIHIHLGSCMSSEFIVLASLISLLRHPADKIETINRSIAVSLLRQLRFNESSDSGEDIFKFCDSLLIKKIVKDYPVEKSLNELSGVHWIKNLGSYAKKYLKACLCIENEMKGYSEFRALLHTELKIRDFLSRDQAIAKLKDKPSIEMAFFAIRFSDIIRGRWDKSDLIRMYMLILASKLSWKIHPSGDKNDFDFLSLFRPGSLSDSKEWKEIWNASHRKFYEKSELKAIDPNVGNFRKIGWALPAMEPPLFLEVPPENFGRFCDNFEGGAPSAEKNPIEYELSTGMRSSSLIEYLEGCEFSGAEHLRHPYLIHLYAQQTVADFVRTGTFYVELRGSPDGFVNNRIDFQFTHVCTCLVEAFSRAQSIMLEIYQRIKDHKGIDDWIASSLGARYDLARLTERWREPESQDAQQPFSQRLPCKVSIIFVGKRHKSTREMILEAAAAAVMRMSEGGMISNAKQFIDNEMKKCRIVGFDLAGREYDNPPGHFAEEFARLSRLHIPLTVHSGENAPASFIEDAIILLQAKRIGHGLALAEDINLMTRAREDRVCIELCPVCNHQTSHFDSPDSNGEEGDLPSRPYPLKMYMEHGLLISISTDNPIISNTNLIKEYFQASHAYDKSGLSLWEALRIMRMAYISTFIPLLERKAMMEVAEQFLFDLLSSDSTVLFLRNIWDNQNKK